MSFTAWYYPFFLASVALLFWQLPQRGRLLLLLAASYVFYGYWDIRFLSLIGASTIMDYLCGLAIEGERRPLRTVAGLVALPLAWFAIVAAWLGPERVPREFVLFAAAAAMTFVLIYRTLWRVDPRRRAAAFLALQLTYNLGILFFFKYFNFFIDSAKTLLAAAGFDGDFTALEILLPVGISFYTFQSIAYAVDIYRGKTHACRDPLLFGAFISFFPQLVAGPIERSLHLLPQLARKTPFEAQMLHEAITLLLVGYFKKVYVANNCALVADYFFHGNGHTSATWVVLGTVAFAFQIYGDFSGYTDIARGSARLLGVRLSHNFHLPYAAATPSEYWSRWHISLSTWIRDYVYIPLGGNRGSRWRTMFNLYAAMLLAGLWHGAAWTFVAWGAYHATLLALYRLVPVLRDAGHWRGWRHIGAVALMFAFTLGGWLIFRAPDAAFIGAALRSLVMPDNVQAVAPADWIGPARWLLAHMLPLWVLQWVTRAHRDEAKLEFRPWPLRGLDYAVMFVLVASSAAIDQEFIYFQF